MARCTWGEQYLLLATYNTWDDIFYSKTTKKYFFEEQHLFTRLKLCFFMMFAKKPLNVKQLLDNFKVVDKTGLAYQDISVLKIEVMFSTTL